MKKSTPPPQSTFFRKIYVSRRWRSVAAHCDREYECKVKIVENEQEETTPTFFTYLPIVALV